MNHVQMTGIGIERGSMIWPKPLCESQGGHARPNMELPCSQAIRQKYSQDSVKSK